jgi:hypothetical protein
MNVAGGNSFGDERWPGHPLAVPRGFREAVWLGAVIVSMALIVTIPAVRFFAFLVAVALLAIRYLFDWFIPPWLLLRGSVPFVGGSALHLTGSLTGEELRALAWVLVTDEPSHLTVEVGTSAMVAVFFLLYGIAVASVSTFVAFDLRSVSREVVDARVWARQQARRRQVMAAHHRRNPPPEAR